MNIIGKLSSQKLEVGVTNGVQVTMVDPEVVKSP